MATLAMCLIGYGTSLANERDPLADLLDEHPAAKARMNELRVSWVDSMAIERRKTTMATDLADSLDSMLWRCQEVKPTPPGMFDSFEVGMAAGSLLVMLIIWALDAQLE